MMEIIEEKKRASKKKTCGIIMPIASHPDYPTEHWNEVYGIIKEAVCETDFEPRIVSADDAIGLIHDRIVTNIYNDEIVICDVSSKNPNVMFELGLRLAFDKPTIIIKDEKTGYSFDTGGIEHIEYPSSLRFNLIVDFKNELIKRVNATYNKSIDQPNYSPFLKSFGKNIVPAKIQQKDITEGKYILDELKLIRTELRDLQYDRIRLKTSKSNINFQSSSFMYSSLVGDIIKNNPDFDDLSMEEAVCYVKDQFLKKNINISTKDIGEYIRKRESCVLGA